MSHPSTPTSSQCNPIHFITGQFRTAPISFWIVDTDDEQRHVMLIQHLKKILKSIYFTLLFSDSRIETPESNKRKNLYVWPQWELKASSRAVGAM